MDRGLPLPRLLSHALVAFTIEFDNEFEHQMPHRTTNHSPTSGSREGPWLVSMAMWSTCMRFIPEEGVSVAKLEDLARTPTNLNGMERWGYIVVEPDAADGRAKPPRSQWLIRATRQGRRAQQIWQPLFGIVENRWQERFGRDEIHRLRDSLWALASQFETDLPDCLPILGYGLFSRAPERKRSKPARLEHESAPDLSLPALLSRVLLAFAIEFEQASEVSLAIAANVLRLVGEEGVRVRDLPRLAAVSKEAIATSLTFLEKRGHAVFRPESAGSRVKLLALTPKGRRAQEAYRDLIWAIQERWQTSFGNDVMRSLRTALERLVGEPTAQSPLFRGLEPYADGWRASVPRPDGFPHYPMVLHRGGFPDGS